MPTGYWARPEIAHPRLTTPEWGQSRMRLSGNDGADDPGRGRRVDAVRAVELGQGLAQLGGDLRADLLDPVAPSRSTSPAGPSAILNSTAWSRSCADLQRQVAAPQRDRLEAGDHELLADRVGVRPSRTARARRSAPPSPPGARGSARRPARPAAPTRCRACAARPPRRAGRPARIDSADVAQRRTGLAKNITPIREKT